MTAPIRTVVVGLGNMGRRHVRCLLLNPRFNVIATVDPLAPEASHGALTTRAYDAAIIATPTPTHFDVARSLLRPGLALLVEKPLAGAHAAAVDLAKAAQAQGTKLAVGHVERFNPAVQALATLLQEGRIGTPIHVSCTRVGGYPAAVTPGNNVSLDLAVHDLDILSTLLGPLKVVASVCHSTVRPDVCDTAEILVRAESGASASCHVNWTSPCKVRQMRVTGTGGVCFVDLIAQTVEVVVGEERTAIEVPRAEPLALELDAFANLIEGRDSGPLCTGEEAAVAVRLAEAALKQNRLRSVRAA